MKHTAVYSKLPLIYDRLMDHVDYVSWSEFNLDLLKHHLPDLISVVDLSCGTGNHLLHLQNKVQKLSGADISQAMVRLAAGKKNLHKIPFFVNDIRYTALRDNTADAVLFLYDSINYITKITDLKRLFSEVKRILRPGGVFLFDTVNELHCLRHYNEENEQVSWDTCGYARYSIYDNRKKRQYTHFRINIGDEFWSEEHIQRIYSEKELRNAAAKCFNSIYLYDFLRFGPPHENSERIHYICQNSTPIRLD